MTKVKLWLVYHCTPLKTLGRVDVSRLDFIRPSKLGLAKREMTCRKWLMVNG